jgi:hypothetical protein
MTDGKLIVLTAPLTEIIDHAGYFIQTSMASLHARRRPRARDVPAARLRSQRRRRLLSGRPAPVRGAPHAGRGGVHAQSSGSDVRGRRVCVDLRVVQPADQLALFATALRAHQVESAPFAVQGDCRRLRRLADQPDQLLGRLSVDCIVEGSESADTLALFQKAVVGEPLPRQVDVGHPKSRESILVPDSRTTFGVVEMTTGCGRRCQFCLPDLNPQLDIPKDHIMKAVRANIRDGNKQISLATEDMFIWGQVHTDTPFYFPNRDALLDLFADVVNTPGVEQHLLSHATIAPAVVDPVLIEKLSDLLLPKSPIKVPMLSSHPEGRALVPLIGLETGSVRMAKQIMPSKGVPFPIEEWPSVVIRGLEVLNANNWFPAITLIVGSPGETDDDVKATLDLIYEVERRGLFAFFIPSLFTPLHDTRLEHKTGVTETRQFTPLQWQLMMKCWKMNLRPGQASWWGPLAWRTGSIGLWLYKLRKLNGPHFTWPLLMFAGALPEGVMQKMGRLYKGRPLAIKTRKELLATVRPNHWRHLREDTGDVPKGAPAGPRMLPVVV